MSQPGMIRIGIGGWVYPPWRGTFYRPGLPQAQELAYASRHLTAIEINGTFYNSGKPDSFRKWRDETPEGFVFSLKGPRFVTHRSELASAGGALDSFFSRGVLERPKFDEAQKVAHLGGGGGLAMTAELPASRLRFS
jgi:uncharacterized protein YecE (DUF72 family)